MAKVSIRDRLQMANPSDEKNLRILLEAMWDDIDAIRTALIGLAAQLDDDGTVTGTDYEANWTPAQTTEKR